VRIYDKTWLKPSVTDDRIRAARKGTWDGLERDSYFSSCHGYHRPSGTMIVFSRDTGHHTLGRWKNPDYERCWHLSMSFRDPATGGPLPRDKKASQEWVKLFFRDHARKLWCEPPFSPEGKVADVWHYRLFCAPDWSPIIPRGEVYSKEFTEAGWLSYSDVQAKFAAEEAAALERLNNK
jgi:hypothetical protein